MRESGENPGEGRNQDRGSQEQDLTGGVVEVLGQDHY